MTIHPRDLRPAPQAQRHDGWTPQRQARFLQTLAVTHSVADAARAVGMSRQSAYRLRARLRGEPFDIAWDAAFQTVFDTLAEAAMERAINGVEVPHFHQGELIHTSRRYDERLTIALLALRHQPRRAHAPSWHPASGFGRDDLPALIDRVASGPATWRGLPGDRVPDDLQADDELEAEPAGKAASPVSRISGSDLSPTRPNRKTLSDQTDMPADGG